MRCSLYDILLAHFFFSFIFKYLFNWRLGSVIIFLLPIRFFTHFKKDMSYFGYGDFSASSLAAKLIFHDLNVLFFNEKKINAARAPWLIK